MSFILFFIFYQNGHRSYYITLSISLKYNNVGDYINYSNYIIWKEKRIPIYNIIIYIDCVVKPCGKLYSPRDGRNDIIICIYNNSYTYNIPNAKDTNRIKFIAKSVGRRVCVDEGFAGDCCVTPPRRHYIC